MSYLGASLGVGGGCVNGEPCALQGLCVSGSGNGLLGVMAMATQARGNLTDACAMEHIDASIPRPSQACSSRQQSTSARLLASGTPGDPSSTGAYSGQRVFSRYRFNSSSPLLGGAVGAGFDAIARLRQRRKVAEKTGGSERSNQTGVQEFAPTYEGTLPDWSEPRNRFSTVGTEWCSGTITHSPASLRGPIVRRKSSAPPDVPSQ